MIELSRRLARQFHTVLRRGLLGRGTRGPWPVVLCKADEKGLTLQARQDELAVRFQAEGSRPPETLAFDGSVLAEWGGNSESLVTLEAVNTQRAKARWFDGRIHRAIEFALDDPDKVPAFPKLPGKLSEMPAGLLTALDAAARTTAPDSVRFALHRVLLRGKSGEILASDGKQLLIQGGYPLPWQDDVLVPRLALFGPRDLSFTGPVSLGRTDSQVAVCVGGWTFVLAIDKAGRFPDLHGVLPTTKSVTGRLQLHPKDADFLVATLPKLPGGSDDNAPITLDLGSAVVVRGRDGAVGTVTEAVLSRSTATGSPTRLVLNRHFLARVAQMGFTEMEVAGVDKPAQCRNGERTYAVMPLEAGAAIPPTPGTLRISSADGPAPDPDPTVPPRQPDPDPKPERERRSDPMPEPSTNGRPPAGIDALLAEAEQLRMLLADASARLGRLLAALKQHRRQARAVQAAVSSLRQMNLDK
jgi:hypothetical protein